ncbi:sulfatase [Maribacter sp. 2307ULW6-5]|uniref:sulfatase family protein n=1 Tax=Maribacter sp. 2307ULW6-5 TaxID=3386275 RepID=UPI0039BD06CB
MKSTIIVLFFIVCLFSCGEADEKTALREGKRPNIVFIMSDDHAIQALSAYGHPLGQLAPTPNIDRIAQNGVLFNRSYVTNSICGPSRAVILTGKHSHINGFRQNGDRFDGSQPTFPKMLQEAGYSTALFGKWHLHGTPEGFDEWKILVDQGNYYNPDFVQGQDTIRVEGYATDLITKDALSWLKSKERDTAPFLLMVQHKAPHRNWMPALRHTNLYDSVTFPLPKTYFPSFGNQIAASQQLQTIYKDMYEGHDLKMTSGFGKTELAHNPWTTDFERMTSKQRSQWDTAYLAKNNAFHKANPKGKELAKWKGQRYLRDYMATIASVDEGVGQILDYLEAHKLDENTLVVYTSDQGFYLGEKGMFDKRFMYEESFGTPLLVQYPKEIAPGQKVDALVQNLDFAPTFLDYAGFAEKSHSMQGVSLKGILSGETPSQDFRNVIYYHYYDFPAFHMVKKHYGIRTDRFKLMHFYDDIDTWEFYDLEKDPKELNNSIDDPSYAAIIEGLHLKLDSVQKQYGVTESEFKKAPKKRIDNAYRQFERMRGIPMQ